MDSMVLSHAKGRLEGRADLAAALTNGYGGRCRAATGSRTTICARYQPGW